MPIRKQQVRTVFGTAVPLIAIVVTQISWKTKSIPVAYHINSPGHKTHSRAESPDRMTSIAERQLIRQALISGHMNLAEAVEAIHRSMSNDTDLIESMRHFYPDHPAEALPIFYLLRYFESLPDNPHFVQLTAELRCEYETRHGPQIWVQRAIGICPYPVE